MTLENIERIAEGIREYLTEIGPQPFGHKEQAVKMVLINFQDAREKAEK